MEDFLLYTGQITQIERQFSNNQENIKIVCLSLRALLNNVIVRKENGDPKFSKTGDPAEILKYIIDYFSTIYPGLITYTNESIQTY
jgi:hypothetical protein